MWNFICFEPVLAQVSRLDTFTVDHSCLTLTHCYNEGFGNREFHFCPTHRHRLCAHKDTPHSFCTDQKQWNVVTQRIAPWIAQTMLRQLWSQQECMFAYIQLVHPDDVTEKKTSRALSTQVTICFYCDASATFLFRVLLFPSVCDGMINTGVSHRRLT